MAWKCKRIAWNFVMFEDVDIGGGGQCLYFKILDLTSD